MLDTRSCSCKLLSAATSVAAIVIWANEANANATGVTAEGVDHYYDSSCNLTSTIVCIAEVDNFRNGLLNKSGTIFTAGQRFVEGNVWDTDFSDPDVPGHSTQDDDTYNFDDQPNGLAYVSVHGDCGDVTNQPCTHSSQCNSPQAGQSLPGECVAPGPNNGSTGWCTYYRSKYLITSSCGSAGRVYGGFLDYTTGHVKWGENASVGAWAGAATNGGIGFGLLVNSCGVRWGYVMQQTLPISAGLSVLGMVMPVTPNSADDVDAPDRGTALANAYVNNATGSIGQAWADSIYGVAQNEGSACGGNNYQFGGGHGMNGCGAQIAISYDSSSADALWDRDTENWSGATVPSNGARGTQYYAWKWSCNYDCNTYPFTLN